ncbi:hypothetical protein CDL12_26847 [Handroanthus impetiginosus]|uniref:Uncharacterized protein n=1 Tax=Handroanthus impetiginosus TaxID=429701 RepID=A0A2G9G5R2_9LAMI|nr:hypothetical protein CDL12_26847 [Handroanthus impetiginosus]
MIEECVSAMTFTNDDLLLGSKPHNRPLFVTGYAQEPKVNRILTDEGSAVNILPLHMLAKLGISMDELARSRLMIQGFNEGDAKTSYNMLLGRPWLHENGVHQCFKYYKDRMVKKVLVDDKPFTEAESHFADAKYYFEKGSKAQEDLSNEQDDQVEGSKIKIKALINPDNCSKASLDEFELPKELILHLTKLDMKKLQPIEGFVRPVEGAKVEHGKFLNLQGEGCFDPKAYKLLLKAGYNLQECLSLEKYSSKFNATQSVLKENGRAIPNAKIGLKFVQRNPTRIAIKRASTNYIVEEEVLSTNDVFDLKGNKVKHLSVFDRLGKLKKSRNNRRFIRSRRSKVTNKLESTQKLRSLILSCMKRHTTLIVSCGRVLKAKWETIVFMQT